MRHIALILTALLLVGCAAHPAEPPISSVPLAPRSTNSSLGKQYTAVRLSLRDYSGVSRDLAEYPDEQIIKALESIGGRVEYASPPIHPTPFYELTLADERGQEAVLSYVGDGNWQFHDGQTVSFFEAKALAEAARRSLPIPERAPGELEHLFSATELKTAGDSMNIPDEVWNRRRQVVVRTLIALAEPRQDIQVPRAEPLRLLFEVAGQTETVEVWDDVFRYRGNVYDAEDVLRSLGSNMSAG